MLSMAADLNEISTEDTESHVRSKRRSFVAMGHDTAASPLTSSPIATPMRSTPPHSSISLDRPIPETFMTPTASSANSPGMTSGRQFTALDHDIAKFAQSPLARAANHDLPGRREMSGNHSMDDLTQRLTAYSLNNRDLPSSAPVTPPTGQGQSYYDVRSRASTLTESSPPLQALQKDHSRIPQHYLTPPSEGQSSPATLVVSQSVPVSRRNSNNETMRVGQDLSIIYENGPETMAYPADHRKSSGTLSGTWSNASHEATFVSPSQSYDDVVESQRSDSVSGKNVFAMLPTENGGFPFLSSQSETNSNPSMPLPRTARHASTPSWPSAPIARNHATRSSYPDQLESRHSSEFEVRGLNERMSANPSPHTALQRTPPKGHSPGRFDLSSAEFIPGQGWHDDHANNRENYSQRSQGAVYTESAPNNIYIPNATYAMSPQEYTNHGSYYAPRGHQSPYDAYTPRQLDSPQDPSPYDHRQQSYFNPRDAQSSTPRQKPTHRRYNSNDQQVLARSRIQDFANRIPELCRDQNGCRHLQHELDTNNPETVDVIYNGAKPQFAELMSDPFGNYLCQKLLEKCVDEQRTELVKIVAPTIVNVSLNQHGTRAVQKMLEHLTLPEQVEIVREALRPDVVNLTKDLNGNHVIQKCLGQLDSEEKQFIYDAVAANCVEVAAHKHGCCVFQRCIDASNPKQREQLFKELIKNAVTLSQDQFGNYVLQYILDKEFADLPLLVNQFKGRVVQLSKAKFSSNVIEKCIRVENGGRESMIEELLAPGAIGELIDDPYGNYVVQTALDFATEDQRHHLISEITPYLQVIKARSWYKRVMNKIHNKRGGRNGDDDTGRYEPSRSQAMVPRQYYEDGMHQRMNSDRAIMPPSMHAYTHVPGDRSPSDHYPPGLMHAPLHHADRNGYRPQIHPQAHAQLHQRYSFYPFPPRGPAPHPADFRGNGDY